MTSLRKGKSAVREFGHVVIIGWNEKTLSVIAQMCLAKEEDGGDVIVVLDNFDNEWMQFQLKSALTERDLRGTEVIFRKGNPFSAFDLRRAGKHHIKCYRMLIR